MISSLHAQEIVRPESMYVTYDSSTSFVIKKDGDTQGWHNVQFCNLNRTHPILNVDGAQIPVRVAQVNTTGTQVRLELSTNEADKRYIHVTADDFCRMNDVHQIQLMDLRRHRQDYFVERNIKRLREPVRMNVETFLRMINEDAETEDQLTKPASTIPRKSQDLPAPHELEKALASRTHQPQPI